MRRLLTILTASLFITSTTYAQQVIDLSGVWQFGTGDTEHYDDSIRLPGSMLTNGKGNDVDIHTQWTGSLYDSSYFFNPYMEPYRQKGQMKFPFFLTPEKHYVGNAWYQRTVAIPKDWDKQQVTLFLERPHIETTVFVNGQEVGHQMSLSVPHCYDVTRYIRRGEQNTIAIRVYNGIENVCVGQDSHSVTDQTQGNWNGIAGRIELQAQPIIWRKKVIPHLKEKKVDIIINEQTYQLTLGDDTELWNEFNPRLYTDTVDYEGIKVPVTFGLREIKIEGRQFYINGQPAFLRGTVENCCFPETGYAPMNEEEWLRIFQKCKEYGLNHVRFHSYCPPEAAFTAADKVGIYLQPEGPSWPNHGVKLRRGQKIDEYLLEESKRIIDTYGHHPSFVMMAAGNEPAGDWVNYCNEWVKQMHAYDSTKVYCGASVGGGWAWDNGSEYHVKGGARGLDWDKKAPQSEDDYYAGIEFPRNYKSQTPNQSPILAHEQGQWCAFPDFKEMSQYTGAYKARNFEIFRDLLRDNGMESMSEKFLTASGRLQTLCYKYEIERNLRTKDYAGFQLLGLNDYSGQGTALVGVLNVHWREKGYVAANEWREFCSSLVLLARFPKFVYANNETLRVPIECMNASNKEVEGRDIVYEIWQDGTRLIGNGTLQAGTIPLGKNHPIGMIHQKLDIIQKPSKLTLLVRLGNQAKNHWDFWVYPEFDAKDISCGKVFITDSLDSKAIKVLKKGGSVLLTAAGKVTLGSDVKQNYLPVFWNTSWFKMRPPHTTGAYIHTDHPLFKYDFPTDEWSNLNWWELLNKAQVMNLMELPKDYQSPIQPIDTWHVSRKLGMMIEVKIGKGRLLMTTMDINIRLDRRPVARQMRKAILAYMQSPDFQPKVEVTAETIRHFFTQQAPAVNMFTNDSPDELKPKLFPSNK
ncbi:MAG: beta-glucuronidase [Prevotella sp.]|nr:beta-glucuronidase [Prevotella sp.]